MAEESEDIVEHIVEIDSYVSVTIKIPKRLSAIDLKALMAKANKMFNLSETPIIEKRRAKYLISNDEEKKKLIEKYQNSSDEEKSRMAQEMGISEKSLYQKVWSFKKALDMPTNDKRRESKRKYSNELVNKLVSMVKSGISLKEISEETKIKRQTIRDIIRNRTGKGIKKLLIMGAEKNEN